MPDMSRPPLSPPVTPLPMRADETDYAQRDFKNLVSAAVLLCLAVMLTWTAGAFFENERKLRCFDSGRKDCASIPTPPQGMRAMAH